MNTREDEMKTFLNEWHISIKKENAAREILSDIRRSNKLWEKYMPENKISEADVPKILDDCDKFVEKHVHDTLENEKKGTPIFHRNPIIDIHFYDMARSEKPECTFYIKQTLDDFGIKDKVFLRYFDDDNDKLILIDGKIDIERTVEAFSESHKIDPHADVIFAPYDFNRNPSLAGFVCDNVVLISTANDLADRSSRTRHEIGGELIGAFMSHCESYVTLYTRPTYCVGGSNSYGAESYCPKCKYVISRVAEKLLGLSK